MGNIDNSSFLAITQSCAQLFSPNLAALSASTKCGCAAAERGQRREAEKEAVLRRGPHREHIHALAPYHRERRQRTPAPETRASRTGRTSAPAADTPPYALPSGLAASYRTSTAPSQSFVKSLEVLEHILVGRAARKEAPLLLHLLLLRINQFNDQEGEGESGGGGGSHAKRIRIQTQKPCLARRKMSVRAAES